MKNSAEILKSIRDCGLLRVLNPAQAAGARIFRDGQNFVNFACNDYLGISADIDLQQEFLKLLVDEKCDFIMSSVSSRLLGGDNFAFENFENFLSQIYSKACSAPKKTLLFNCGYHANTGVLSALATSKDLIIADRLSHASIIDCLKLTDAKWLRFKHNDYDNLRDILKKNRGNFENVFIATESVFSMDGDRADIQALADIKREFDALLYVDEAHGVGLYGSNGLGLAQSQNQLQNVDFLMCTLGKALASAGAFLVCGDDVRQILINKCRTFIFTTAMAPINVLWSEFIFKKMMAMSARREHLAVISKLLRKSLTGLNTLGDSQIVPVILGENSIANAVSEKLFDAKIWAPAVRYPSVPKGQARLRLSLNADMSTDLICDCAAKILEVAQ